MAPLYGTQKWHHVHPKVGRHPPLWHPAMAPSNGTTSTTPKLVLWHPAMAPNNGTTSTTPKLVVTLPLAPCNGTKQRHHVHSPKVGRHPPLWHPAMAPSNGTTSTPPNLPPNHSTLQWHPTIAPSNGTTSSAPCNGTLVPRPIRQSGSSPSSPIGSKNLYSDLGKNVGKMCHKCAGLRLRPRPARRSVSNVWPIIVPELRGPGPNVKYYIISRRMSVSPPLRYPIKRSGAWNALACTHLAPTWRRRAGQHECTGHRGHGGLNRLPTLGFRPKMNVWKRRFGPYE